LTASRGNRPDPRDESGSAVVEFVFVGALLTVLTLAVIQLGLALLVRNTVLDAAAEGARYASLADNTPSDGVQRTRELIDSAVGSTYSREITPSTGTYLGTPAVIITVKAPVPVIGLLGVTESLEVSGHAPIEQLP
jgi:hypothetical protein